MAFQIKDFVSITASMLNHMRGTTTKITDLQPGSVSRTLVEAPAVEIEELYLQIFNGLREAIPVATFKSFGFGKLPAAYARGFVSVSRDEPPAAFTVPTGTEFSASDGRRYFSTEDVAWPDGATQIRIPVMAEAAGQAYNIASGSINASPAFDSSYTISNSAIASGRDIETDAEQEARFAAFIGSLSRGTIFACLEAAKSATVLDEDGNIKEYVTRSGYTEIPGYVRIYLYSSAGIPSPALLSWGQSIINGSKDIETGAITPGFRAGGVRIDVLPVAEKAVPLDVRVGMQPGYVLDAATEQRMADEYATLLASVPTDSVLYLESIETELLSVTGVKTVLISANENITCEAHEALIPGTFTVTPL